MATICVFCASSEQIAPTYVDLAHDVGTELARRGHDLVSGGGSVSCMGAVARAARAGGARTVGVIPHALTRTEIADHDADELVVTDDMRTRKGEMDRRADAFLALPGGIGTVEELMEIWVSRVLQMHDKPVVVLDPDGVFSPLREQIDVLVRRGFARPSVRDAVVWATSVGEAFDALERPSRVLPPTGDEVLEAEPAVIDEPDD
jgi:uncharacterized protein (TIGR00730 family)